MTAPREWVPLPPSEALVVFSGSAAVRWLRVLKTGFRHCFLVIQSAGNWIIYDPLAGGTELAVVEAYDGDELAEFFAGYGLTVVKTRSRRLTQTPIPWRPFTCVEAVKRGLGIRDGSIWTPWQLYQYVKKNQI